MPESGAQRGSRFRELGLVHEPAPQRRGYVVIDPTTGTTRPRTLADHHRDIDALALPATVPEDLREHFDTARNLLLYAWFVWEFIPVAELHAYGTVEMALRGRLGYELDGNGPRFSALFRQAIAQGFVVDAGFRHFHRLMAKRQGFAETVSQVTGHHLTPPPPTSPQAYSLNLARYLPRLRNRLAHGTRMLMPHGLRTLELCADAISQLLGDSTTPPVGGVPQSPP